jgi:TRAP-type C4-dicarboxylate transport system substrate-binding protein
MDGELGALVRKGFDKAGLYAFEKIWNNGFRQITTSKKPIKDPSDLASFKIRVPVSQVYVSLFKALGASPTSINLSDVYTALQTVLSTDRKTRWSLPRRPSSTRFRSSVRRPTTSGMAPGS